jgi:hypothetical protein
VSLPCIGGSKKRFNVDYCYLYGNNTSGTLTGNAHVVSPAPVFSNCVFQCNSGQFGPSLGHGQIFQNSLFINNQNSGGVIRFGTNFTGNSSNLDHCTFYNNTCNYFNGTASNHTGLVTSTIFFPGEARDHVSGWQSSISFANSLGDGISGNGNIQGNPLFLDPNSFDFNLSAGSPCIGTGVGGSDIGADMSQFPLWMFNFMENYSVNYNDMLWENGSSQDTILVFPNMTQYISISFTDIGCGGVIQDSILINVNQPTTSNITEANCDTYTAPDGIVYTTTGNYTAVIPNAQGCDSTITIDLTITNSSSSSITEAVCDSYTAPDGTVYTTTGNYTAVIPNAAGCDSTVILNLTITNSTTSSEIINECSTYTWGANNQTYTQSGQYTVVLTNAAGCDSTVTLNLTITEPTTGSETITECSTFTWGANNQTYTQSGQYTAVLTNAVGCDSTVTLDLTITEPSTGSETITECDSYTWNTNGQTYTQSGQYAALLTNAAGCDSTVTLNLTVEVVDITTPPADQTVVVGSSAQFTVTTSAVNPTYQWQLDNGTGWTNLSNAGQYSGVNTAVLTISNVQLNQDNFLYRCLVNAGNCSATSSVARLSVDDNVGLEELSKNVLQLYPNPASSSITLASDHIINTSYRIIDAQGREVKKGYHEGKSSAINIENLSTGSYTIIFDQQTLKEIKFIKE